MITKTFEAYGLKAEWATDATGLVSLLSDEPLDAGLNTDELGDVIDMLIEMRDLTLGA